MYHPGVLLMPSRRHYGQALYMFQMSWHCAPLKSEGAFSLSGNPMRGKPQSVSNQKGSSPCLQSEDWWSQSPICWPVQITVDWPIERLSSRDGTYLSVMQWSQLFSHLKLIQYLNHKLHRITYQHCCQSTTPKYFPLFQENHNHQTGYYIYNVWSFFIQK